MFVDLGLVHYVSSRRYKFWVADRSDTMFLLLKKEISVNLI